MNDFKYFTYDFKYSLSSPVTFPIPRQNISWLFLQMLNIGIRISEHYFLFPSIVPGILLAIKGPCCVMISRILWKWIRILHWRILGGSLGWLYDSPHGIPWRGWIMSNRKDPDEEFNRGMEKGGGGKGRVDFDIKGRTPKTKPLSPSRTVFVSRPETFNPGEPCLLPRLVAWAILGAYEKNISKMNKLMNPKEGKGVLG